MLSHGGACWLGLGKSLPRGVRLRWAKGRQASRQRSEEVAFRDDARGAFVAEGCGGHGGGCESRASRDAGRGERRSLLANEALLTAFDVCTHYNVLSMYNSSSVYSNTYIRTHGVFPQRAETLRPPADSMGGCTQRGNGGPP